MFLTKFIDRNNFIFKKAVADPGFPRGGGANPKGGVPTYYLANFSQNCMKMKNVWATRGARVPRAAPFDPPLKRNVMFEPTISCVEASTLPQPYKDTGN